MTTFALKDARNDKRNHRATERRSRRLLRPDSLGFARGRSHAWPWRSSLAPSVFPLLYMISLSFQPTNDILTSSPVLVPDAPDAS